MQNCVSDGNIRRSGRAGGHQRRRRRLRSVDRLTDDLISEILSRVPYRSLCRFKCVSRSWLALCSSPDMIRPTLSGFFFNTISVFFPDRQRHSGHFRFVSISERFPLMEGPLFCFLPPEGVWPEIIDSCNGLILFDRRRELSRYFVCNPATGNWINLPDIEPMWDFLSPVIRLGFDPAVSSHFRVFLVVHHAPEVDVAVAGVHIYSSETRGWAYRKSRWGDHTALRYQIRTGAAFFNGTLHLAAFGSSSSPSIVTVDKDGKTWRTIPAPRNFEFIALSRSCLYAVDATKCDSGYRLSIWALEDYNGHEWILKHTSNPFAPTESYVVGAIHPEDTLIFLRKSVGAGFPPTALVSYDFMNSKVHTIEYLGGEYRLRPYPYTPCFSKWLSDGH